MITFSLDVVVSDNTKLKSQIEEAGGKFLGLEDFCNIDIVEIEAKDMETANAVVNAVYGPENSSRDSNVFYITGKE